MHPYKPLIFALNGEKHLLYKATEMVDLMVISRNFMLVDSTKLMLQINFFLPVAPSREILINQRTKQASDCYY